MSANIVAQGIAECGESRHTFGPAFYLRWIVFSAILTPEEVRAFRSSPEGDRWTYHCPHDDEERPMGNLLGGYVFSVNVTQAGRTLITYEWES
jgi:hypothetical protein